MTSSNGTFAASLAAQRPATESFDVFFDLHLIKRLSKQSIHRWCETPSLWRHCNAFYPNAFFVAKLYTQSVTRVSDNPTAADSFNVQAKWQKQKHACDLLLFLVDTHGSDEKYLNDHATLYINWIYRSTCCWKNVINVISYIFHDPNCSCRGYWTEELIYRFFLALV